MMPWKEADVVNLPTEFVLRALRQQLPFVALCREYGISAKSGYKWKGRLLKDGLAGLRERSRRPRSSPNQLSEDEACQFVRLKLAHPRWGPKKIRELFARKHPQAERPSLSTVKRILGKAGLVAHRRRRRPEHCGRIENPVRPERPNQLWTVDFKGWCYSAQKARVEPLTVREAYSRYLLCVQRHSRTEGPKPCEGDSSVYSPPMDCRRSSAPTMVRPSRARAPRSD